MYLQHIFHTLQYKDNVLNGDELSTHAWDHYEYNPDRPGTTLDDGNGRLLSNEKIIPDGNGNWCYFKNPSPNTENTQNTRIDIDRINNWAISAVEQSGTPFFPEIEVIDEIDFSLKVASCGANSPLINSRQYSKHQGRTLTIKTSDKEYEGKLISANDKFINLVWKVREPKPVGKGKITVEKSIDIDFNKIEEAKVKVKF